MNTVDRGSERAFSVSEAARLCGVDVRLLGELIDDGVCQCYADPHGRHWIGETALEQVRTYQRLKAELGINHEGAEFAVLLLEDLRELRARVADFHSVLSSTERLSG